MLIKCHCVIIQVISESALSNLREAFMDAFDENEDNKIEISEVSIITVAV